MDTQRLLLPPATRATRPASARRGGPAAIVRITRIIAAPPPEARIVTPNLLTATEAMFTINPSGATSSSNPHAHRGGENLLNPKNIFPQKMNRNSSPVCTANASLHCFVCLLRNIWNYSPGRPTTNAIAFVTQRPAPQEFKTDLAPLSAVVLVLHECPSFSRMRRL